MRVLRALIAVAVASGIVMFTPVAAQADDTRARQWYLDALDIPDTHKTSTGDGITIGLIDVNIDTDHQDLQGAMAEGSRFGETADQGDAAGGNGTADAAILAGRGHGDGAGILGIAPGAQVVPAEIGTAGPDAQNQATLVSSALKYLITREVDVIVVAIPVDDDPSLSKTIKQAHKANIPLVATNEPTEGGDSGFPAGEGVVTALGSDKSSDAVPGASPAPPHSETVTALAAPSVDMPSAQAGNNYSSGSDTSFAAQIIAGTIALVKEQHPDLTGDQLISTVRNTASGKGKYDSKLGYGVVDPGNAIKADATTNQTSVGEITSDNTLLALIIAVAGVLGLTALVVIVRVRDRSRCRALATAAANPAAAAPPAAGNFVGGHTGELPRVSETGSFPRVTDTPPGGTVQPQRQNQGGQPPPH